MPSRINIEELKTLIANEIKKENLSNHLPADAIERIKEKVMMARSGEKAEEIPGIVSELGIPATAYVDSDNTNINREFPDETQLETSPSTQVDMTGDTESFFVEPGSEPTGEESNPTMGYTPELPEMLKKAEPSQLIVFQYNDVSENGENLSYKPMRLMDDPDVKKSMHDLWIEEGKTKADVYVAKFEKIGEINFNYTDGTSQFIDRGSLPDYTQENKYKENPYEAESLPQIDSQTQDNLENYIKNSVDLEKVVHDIVMGIVKDSLLTNTEKAEISNTEIPQETIISQQNEYIQESELSMKEIMTGDFQRVVLPNELNESIISGKNNFLIKEGEEVNTWSFDNRKYFTPVGRISKDKGYIKIG